MEKNLITILMMLLSLFCFNLSASILQINSFLLPSVSFVIVSEGDNNYSVPYIKADWKLLFKPEKTGDYINDHTLYQDNEGKWHLIGTTGKWNHNSDKERYLAHGAGNSLTEELPFVEMGKICDYGHKSCAPHSINIDGKCHLFWGPDVLRLDTSIDMVKWRHHGVMMDPNKLNPSGIFRDTMMLKYKDRWLMYTTGVKGGYGTIDLWESTDLKKWKMVGRALTTSGNAPLNPSWGACNSPFVLKKGEWYYLFVTYTDCGAWNYQNTLVFKSKDPYNFGDYDGDDDNVVTRLAAHAPEVVKNSIDGKWYLTSCGWKGSPVVEPGGVAIAELGWYKNGDKPGSLKGQLEQYWTLDKAEAGVCGNIEFVAGKVGKSARFDGKRSWINMPDLYLNRDFTVSAWVNFDGIIDHNDALLGQEGEGQDINFYGGRLHIFGPKDIYKSKTVFESGKWYHIGIVRSECHKLTVYVNGEVDGTGLWTGCFQPKAIGRGNGKQSFKGMIDELNIYSCAKNENEIKELMSKK